MAQHSDAKKSTVGEITIRQARDQPQAVDTLVHAFAEDPGASHLFPSAAKRAAGMAWVHRLVLRYSGNYGVVEVALDCAAVAAWVGPKHTRPTWWQMGRVGILATPFAVGLRATWRILRFQRLLENFRRRHIKTPHWYLAAIGVRPGQQGQGLGSVLLQHGVQRAQAAGFPCYLETTNPANLSFYEKQGFRVMGEQRPSQDGPGIWSLVAASASLTSSAA